MQRNEQQLDDNWYIEWTDMKINEKTEQRSKIKNI